MSRPQLEVFTVDTAETPDVMVVEVARWDEALSAARAEGYAAGHAAAEMVARAKVAQVEVDVLQVLERLDAQHAALEERFSNLTGQILLAVCQKVLPVLGRETLGAHLRETLNHVLREPFDQPITLEVNPLSAASVARWMARSKVIAWKLQENPDLGVAASRLHLPESTLHLDLNRTAEEIGRHIRDYFSQKLEIGHD